MCKSQGDLQRGVPPTAVRAYLYVRRYIGMRFFYICAQNMVLNAVCDSKHEPIAFLECNIVTVFTG
jgi:hypothetical protein